MTILFILIYVCCWAASQLYHKLDLDVQWESVLIIMDSGIANKIPAGAGKQPES